jgi:4-amino-4-deoxy-L-arabinose transferase-like glycosyltransferase
MRLRVSTRWPVTFDPVEWDVPRGRAGAVVALLAFAKFAIQFATAGQYGIFRDELYYVALARHLAWGYVDEPPLIALVTWFSIHVFGTSLYGLRVLPAVAGGALVWVTAEIARELGGGGFARCLAACAVIPVPIYLMLNHWLTMNAFEPLLWTALFWAAARMVSRVEPRYWLAVGALCGIGLENKYSMVFPAAALAFGLLLTPERRMLKTWWAAAGAAIAFGLFLPNLLWLIGHDFPFLAFERLQRLSGDRILRSPLAFIGDQIVIMNPLLAPLWGGGLVWLLISQTLRRYRFLGWAFLSIFLALLILKAKNYYVAPAYPVLFAAGAVALERATQIGARWLRSAYAGSVLAAGLVLAPFVLPVLPVDDFLAYQRAFGGFTPIRWEKTGPGLLPQQFADEFGWEDMARKTALVFNALPEAERKDAAIFGNNYGESAAIDFFGPKYGLPPAIGKDVSYWVWGPRDYTGATVIVLGSDGTGDRAHFRTVEAVGRVGDAYARANERFDIYLCRDLSTSLDALWPALKGW